MTGNNEFILQDFVISSGTVYYGLSGGVSTHSANSRQFKLHTVTFTSAERSVL